VRFGFNCTNAALAPTVAGLNTLLRSASADPVPDLVALAVTPSGDGIVNGQAPGAAAFSVAVANAGAGADITVTADAGPTPPPVARSLCETTPATGQGRSAIGSRACSRGGNADLRRVRQGRRRHPVRSCEHADLRAVRRLRRSGPGRDLRGRPGSVGAAAGRRSKPLRRNRR
jgi:hypothetical protein